MSMLAGWLLFGDGVTGLTSVEHDALMKMKDIAEGNQIRGIGDPHTLEIRHKDTNDLLVSKQVSGINNPQTISVTEPP